MPTRPRLATWASLVLLFAASAQAADLRFAHGLYRDKRYANAAEEYRSFLDQNPNDAKADEARYYLGESLVQLKKFDEAATAFEGVKSDQAYRKGALFRAASIRFRASDAASAERSFEQFVAEFPDDADAAGAWLQLAQCRLALKKTGDAQKALRSAESRIEEGSRWWGRLQLVAAEIHQAVGRTAAAVEVLQALAASKDPLSAEASQRLGGVLFADRRFADAASLFDKAAARAKDSVTGAQANYNAGLCFLELKNWPEATRRLSTALEAMADDKTPSVERTAVAAAQALVLAQLGSGDRRSARAVIEVALKRFGDGDRSFEFRRLAAEIDLQDGRASEAAAQLKELLRTAPASADRKALISAGCRAAAASADASWAAQLLRQSRGDAQSEVERILSEAEWKDAAAVASLLKLTAGPIAKARLNYRLAALEIDAGETARAITRLQALLRTTDIPPNLRRNVDFVLGGALVQRQQWAEAIEPLEAYLTDGLRAGSEDEKNLQSAATWWARSLTWLSDADAQRHLEPLLSTGRRPLFETIAASFAAERRSELALWLLGKLSGPETPATAVIAARCYVDLKNPQEALRRLANPETAEEKYLAGVARLQLDVPNETQAGRTLLQQVADADPPTPWSLDAALRLARLAKNSTEAVDAEGRLTRLAASARGPEVRRLRLETAFLAAESGRTLQAIADLKAFLDQEKGSPEAVEAALKLSDLYEARGETAPAQEALSSAEQLDAGRTGSGALLFRRATLAFRAKDWSKAESLLSELRAKFPRDDSGAAADLMLAEIALERQHGDEAVQRFSALKEKAKGGLQATATLRLAQALLVAKKYDEAEKAADEFLAMGAQPAGRIAEAHFVRGRSLMVRAKFEAARMAFEKAAVEEGTELAAKARFMIGETFFHQKRYESAVKEYLKLAVLGGDDQWRAASVLQVGKCHENLGDFAAAADDYRRVVDQFPSAAAAKEARERLQHIQLGARQSERGGVKDE
nr:cell division coordinator CpoB [uncultured bacterium]